MIHVRVYHMCLYFKNPYNTSVRHVVVIFLRGLLAFSCPPLLLNVRLPGSPREEGPEPQGRPREPAPRASRPLHRKAALAGARECSCCCCSCC